MNSLPLAGVATISHSRQWQGIGLLNRRVFAIQGMLPLPAVQLVNTIVDQAIAIQELQIALKIIAALQQ